MYIFNQIIGVILIIVCSASFFFKKKEHFLMCITVYNLLVLLLYILQNQLTESIITFIGIIRCFVFFGYEKKNKRPNVIVLIIFELMCLIIGIITAKQWYSLLIVLSSLFSTFAQWQKNMFVLRVLYCICSVLMIINYACLGLYTSIISEIISLSATIISIFKFHIIKKDKQIEPISSGETTN